MRRVTRFVAALVLGLGLADLDRRPDRQRTTREWFDKDVGMRARSSPSAAPGRRSFPTGASDASAPTLLADITRDERVMAAAACSDDLSRSLTKTTDFPARFSCASSGPASARRRGRRCAGSRGGPWRRSRAGTSHVSAIPVARRGRALGFVVLVHDLSFVETREATTADGSCSSPSAFWRVAAAGVTLFAARLSWRGWSDELRGLAAGAGAKRRPEFQSDHEGRPRSRGAHRRREGRRPRRRGLDAAAAVAHVEPPSPRRKGRDRRQPRAVHPERTATAGSHVLHPASGLVTALEPVMRACSGTWVAHGSGSADSRDGRPRRPHPRPSRRGSPMCSAASGSHPRRRRATTTASRTKGCGRSATSPHTRPAFRSEDWEHYQEVNEKFADARLRGGGLQGPDRPRAGLPLRAASRG